MASRGRIMCSEPEGTIGVILYSVPVLYGYSEDGKFLYHVRLMGISPRVIEERGIGRSLRYKEWSVGQSVLVRPYVDAAGDFNLTYWTRVERGQKTPTHLYRVNAQTGEGQFLGNAPLIYAAHRDYFVQMWVDPYPFFRIIGLEEK